MRQNGVAVLALGIALVVGSCTKIATPSQGDQQRVDQQTVTGKFVRVGGPAPGSPVPLPGTITARSVTGQTFTAMATRNGRFELLLPPGRYHVTGRSPLMQSGQMICGATTGLLVTHGKAAGPVTVICSIR